MTKEFKNFIAGECWASGETFEKHSLFDGSLVASVRETSEDMVNDAVLSSREVPIGAKAGFWGVLLTKERLAIIHDFADKLLGHVGDFVEAHVADTGRSYWQANAFDGARAARLFHAYADAALTMENRSSQFGGEIGGRLSLEVTSLPQTVSTRIHGESQ